MEDSLLITLRYKNFTGSKEYKGELQSSLFEIMKENDFFKLRRNKVLIKNTTTQTKDKFIILDVFQNDTEEVYYCCPVCTDKKIVECLSDSFSAEALSSCLHSDACKILWGNEYHLQTDSEEEKSLVEIIKNEPMYMAVVHPPIKNEKKAGLVVLTTKTLTPKCLTCSSRGKNFCLHIKIHMDKIRKDADKSSESSDEGSDVTKVVSQNDIPKILRNKRIEQKEKVITENENEVLNPLNYRGAEANVFNVTINFIPTKEEEIKNRKISDTNQIFQESILIPKYRGKDDLCVHGNEYNSGKSILWKESTSIEVHHTKEVNTKDLIVLFRPTIVDKENEDEKCNCKKFYTGENEHVLRVSSASFIQSNKSRAKILHFVSYELLFKFLGQLLMGGEKLDAFMKANNFMNEVFFGLDNHTLYPKILQKGFEIFIHALKFPEKANFCFECPQQLEEGENEDDFDDIEYSVVDGIQMGCQTNDGKGQLQKEYFEEETDGDILVRGVECKDRACLNSQKKRDAISGLLKELENKSKLKETILKLEKTKKDNMTEKVLLLLRRINKESQNLPKGEPSKLKSGKSWEKFLRGGHNFFLKSMFHLGKVKRGGRGHHIFKKVSKRCKVKKIMHYFPS